MIEKKQLLRVLEGVIIAMIFGALYAIGGSEEFWGGQKWIRRFLAPALFYAWAYFRSGRDWRQLISMPLLMGALTLPYGADKLLEKIGLRAMCGLANGVSSSVTLIWDRNFKLTIFHILFCLVTSIYLGAVNPFHDAIAEQFAIGFFIIFIPAISMRRLYDTT